MFQKLKAHWGITSTAQALVICIVFSLAGMSILPTRKWVFHLLHFDGHTPLWLKSIAWLCVVFPTYQLSLLVYGALFGQFRFFWEKEKKLARAILRPFTSRTADATSLHDANGSPHAHLD